MGRPCGCCADCVSIWSIDNANGNIKWKKNFGYVYDITEYGDFLFALVYDTESQVVCIRKSNGAKVSDKSFPLHFLPSTSKIEVTDENNIFIINPTAPNTGTLYRYINKELTDLYLFNSANYKFLNNRMFGFGNNTEDYHKYTIVHQNTNGFLITFEDIININDIIVTLNVETEDYNLEWIVSLSGQNRQTLISSNNDIQLPDIIDSINFGSNFIELNFNIVPEIKNITFSEEIDTDYSINDRIFGTLSRNATGVAYNDGLNNRLQSSALKSYSELDSQGYEPNPIERYGEIFNVLYDTNTAINIPALIEEFDLVTLEYNRYEFSDKNDTVINQAQNFLTQEYQINTIEETPTTVLGYPGATLPVSYIGGYEYFRPWQMTLLQTTHQFIRNDNKKIDGNRDFEYGYAMTHTDSNDNTRKTSGPNLPSSEPIQTITAYVNANSGTSWYYYLDQVPDIGEFITEFNNPIGYLKNVFYNTKIIDIQYDSKNEKYILNSEYNTHWIYLREEFLGYSYNGVNSGWTDILDKTIISTETINSSNAANISISYIGPSQSHNDPELYSMSLYFPIEGSVSLAEDYRYCYVLTQSNPLSDYLAGNFIIQSQTKNIGYNLRNRYGFNVSVDRETGVESGNNTEREMVFHKFTEPVLSGFDYPAQDSARMIWTVPMFVNITTSDFETYEFLDIDNYIYPYNTIPTQSENTNFLESLFDRTLSDPNGIKMHNKVRFNSYLNQPKRYPIDLRQEEDRDISNFYNMDFDLNEVFNHGFPKQRYNSKADINIDYFKDKTKLSYNGDNSESILYNNSVRLVVSHNENNYIYYKSLDGNLSTSVDIYHIRYNLSETTVSGLCPIIVFQPVIAPGIENGQIKIVLRIITCNYNNGIKTYKIKDIERDIDLLDGDLTPILEDLNSSVSGGSFSFLTTNTNIVNDWVMMIFDSDIEIDIFSGTTEQITEEVLITSNTYQNGLIDGQYAYARD